MLKSAKFGHVTAETAVIKAVFRSSFLHAASPIYALDDTVAIINVAAAKFRAIKVNGSSPVECVRCDAVADMSHGRHR